MARGIGLPLVLLLEVMVAIIASVVIANFLNSAWNPHEQAAFASAEALALTIDEVCGRQLGFSKELDVNVPQPTPPVIGGTTLFPQIGMRINGDPHYLLYYENFPPGEAISWEIYNNFPERAVVFADPDEGETLGEYVGRFRQNLQAAGFSTELSRYVFGNIVLNDVPEKGETRLAGDIGHWEGNVYKFDKTPVLAKADQSLAKYRTCSPFSLCFKTRQGIVRIPLHNCRRANVTIMQVEREPPSHPTGAVEDYGKTALGGIAIGTATGATIGAVAGIWTGPGVLATTLTGAKIGAWVGGSLGVIGTSFKRVNTVGDVSDFYLASPCKAKAEITKTTCECRSSKLPDAVLPETFKKEYTSDEFGIYEISSGNLVSSKEKSACIHQYSRDDKLEERELEKECVKVRLDVSEGSFCTGGQNELGQVTLSTVWHDSIEKGLAQMFDTKELRKEVTVGEKSGFIQKAFGGLRVPFGWPVG
ncbi:MAG: glycine zipper family protein [Candidatus Aenigmarchaeota archaeon]|nr:glycine zipper family protein [Candidatus Aenigmarchaeota archaeon]